MGRQHPWPCVYVWKVRSVWSTLGAALPASVLTCGQRCLDHLQQRSSSSSSSSSRIGSGNSSSSSTIGKGHPSGRGSAWRCSHAAYGTSRRCCWELAAPLAVLAARCWCSKAEPYHKPPRTQAPPYPQHMATAPAGMTAISAHTWAADSVTGRQPLCYKLSPQCANDPWDLPLSACLRLAWQRAGYAAPSGSRIRT